MRKEECNFNHAAEIACRTAGLKRLGPRGETPWHYPTREPSRGASAGPSEPLDRGDLCCICTYVGDCMYRSTPQEPKLHCELFDVDVHAFAARETGIAPRINDGEETDIVGGLCSNCENRRDCTVRSWEGTVWHCEEYC